MTLLSYIKRMDPIVKECNVFTVLTYISTIVNFIAIICVFVDLMYFHFGFKFDKINNNINEDESVDELIIENSFT